MHCADSCAPSADGTLKTRPLSGVKNVPVYQGLCFLGARACFSCPLCLCPYLVAAEPHCSGGKGLRTHGDACLAASFVPLHVKRHAHGKGPMLYEWRPYKIITPAAAVLCVGLSGMVQLDSRARFHPELREMGCGEALQAG